MPQRSFTSRRSVGDLIDDIVPDIDRLAADAKQIRNQHHFDELESEADAICTRIRAAFRKCG